MYVAAIVAAGGSGRRFGSTRPETADRGRRPYGARAQRPRIPGPSACRRGRGRVAGRPAHRRRPRSWVARRSRCVWWQAVNARQDSVANAFAAIGPLADVIVIHDAARPLVDADVIDRTIAAAAASGAAIAAVPAHDTVKLAAETGEDRTSWNARWIATRVWLAQTPQAFTRRVLEDALAHGRKGAAGTDEAALAEQAGHAVRLVEGNARNLKITTPDDLAQVERWLTQSTDGTSDPARCGLARCVIGIGYDSHRLVEGRPLLLGGVAIPQVTRARRPFRRRCAVPCRDGCHPRVRRRSATSAVTFRIPIHSGRMRTVSFCWVVPMRWSDPGASRCGTSMRSSIAERPKLAPHVDQIRASLAGALSIDVDAVSVKGKTNEGMGEVGRGEAIIVHAVAIATWRVALGFGFGPQPRPAFSPRPLRVRLS